MVKRLELERNILFFDFFDDHDLVCALMKSSKVFFLPSTREGFGTVVIEANACGLPAIVIDHKNNAAIDLIKDGENGFICDYNPEVIAVRILLLFNMIKNNKIKNFCKESAKIYDWNNIVNEIEAIYLR
jgi:glycosyltransferase involved in cell wall biosynthesis